MLSSTRQEFLQSAKGVLVSVSRFDPGQKVPTFLSGDRSAWEAVGKMNIPENEKERLRKRLDEIQEETRRETKADLNRLLDERLARLCPGG